jgi:hypothetical protein
MFDFFGLRCLIPHHHAHPSLLHTCPLRICYLLLCRSLQQLPLLAPLYLCALLAGSTV